MASQHSEARNRWLSLDLAIDNRLRQHSALGLSSPQQRLDELLR